MKVEVHSDRIIYIQWSISVKKLSGTKWKKYEPEDIAGLYVEYIHISSNYKMWRRISNHTHGPG